VDPKKQHSYDLSDWFVKDVALSLFPIFAAFSVDYLKTGSIDVAKIIGDGTLVLSSFSIAAPSVINTIKITKIDNQYKHHGYLVAFFCFFLLLIYATFKTATKSDIKVVITVSILSLIFSVVASYRDYYLRDYLGVNDD